LIRGFTVRGSSTCLATVKTAAANLCSFCGCEQKDVDYLSTLVIYNGIPRCRWVDNIRMDLGEVGWGDVDWVGLAKDRNWWRAVVNSVLNLRVP
jgi:hypothetical protein